MGQFPLGHRVQCVQSVQCEVWCAVCVCGVYIQNGSPATNPPMCVANVYVHMWGFAIDNHEIVESGRRERWQGGVGEVWGQKHSGVAGGGMVWGVGKQQPVCV